MGIAATLIDNTAYAKFKMGDTAALPGMFYNALKIRDSLNITPDIFLSKINLTEYYTQYKDTVKALKYVHEARQLALHSNNPRDLLTALQWLSRLEKCENGVVYLEEYIKINDSLQLAERNLRGKFTRIQFETDQLVLEKTKLTKDKIRF